jgi:hypothetical protein
MRQGEGGYGTQEDREVCVPVGSSAAYRRYRCSEHWAANNDGRHVDAEVGVRFNHRRIRNLSDRQHKILAPKVDRSEVSI